MDKETYPDPRVVVLSQEIVFAKVNGKEDTVLSKQYSIAAFPTAVIATAEGVEIDRLVGFFPAEEFTTTIQDYLAGRNTLADLEARAVKNPDDLQLTFRLGDKYLWRGEYAGAETAFRKILEQDPENKTGKADSAAHYLGYSAYRQKEYQEAIQRFNRANQMFPESPWAEENDIYIPAAYEKAGETQMAIEFYQKYLEAWPEGDDREYAREHLEKLKQESASTEKK